jgi:hypothetical protein
MEGIVFDTTKNYLILGEKNTNKTELGKVVSNNINSVNNVYFNLFDDNYTPFNKNDSKECTTLVLDNYSTKDKKNNHIKEILDDKTKAVVIIAPYVISTDNIKHCFDYVFISKIKDQHTLKVIYNVYFKHIDCFDFEKFQELNNKTRHFLVIEKKYLGIGYYNPSKGFTDKSVTTVYERFSNWWNK